MKHLTNLFLNIALSMFSIPTLAQHHKAIRLQAEDYLNSNSSIKIPNSTLSNNFGVSLFGNDTDAHSISYEFTLPEPGLYSIESYAITDDFGTTLMKNAKSKFESLFMTMQVNEQNKTKRVVAVPWNNPKQEIGKFELNTNNIIKLWLPKGVVLDYIDIVKYQSPKVPDKIESYQPKFVPQGHPRLWVNKNTLEQVRRNLDIAENKDKWYTVRNLALEPVNSKDISEEISFDEHLEKQIEAKAFYYLMTKDKKVGTEAINLTKNYISNVSFGNILDITREIGRTIHITSEVYDWCYDLMSKDDLAFFRKHLMRLSIDMEIGWPPFLQPVVNGHGAEAQVKRDLLSMAIAIYDEDELPYKYCSYLLFEELIPMRRFEYQSPRHNQGVNYGAYRINWDFHAAWLLKRMLNKEVFDSNIKNTADYWLYFRLPDGQMLRDGDQSLSAKTGEYNYWQINPTSFFMNYSYSENPYLKHSFEKMNSTTVNPVLFLLLNNPKFKSSPIPSDYPLNKDFGPILGGMVNRTGWDDDIKSNDVVAEIKGGGYYFSNHQHNDAGALQIYHHGFQVADLGQYKFYGTPYDLNFTKRSVSHSMMLAIDSSEKIGNIPSNDGGTRMFRKIPNSPQELIENPGHHNGKVLSASTHSKFNFFSVDLQSAYSNKLKEYSRDYVFINTGNQDIPAIIILKDQMLTKSPEIKKYWQVNTLNRPSIEKNNQIKLNSPLDSINASTYINFIYPSEQELEKIVLSENEAHNIFGFQVAPPVANQLESNGHRILVTPKKSNEQDQFLSVFQMANMNAAPYLVDYKKSGKYDYLNILNMIILLRDGNDLNKQNIDIELTEIADKEVFVTGLFSGSWKLKNNKGKVIQTIEVLENKNTAIFTLGKGKYKLELF